MPVIPSRFERTRLFTDSQGMSVVDCRCRLHRHAHPGPEEPVDRASIVFVRRGVFQRSLGREALTADANQVLFFNPGDGYRYAHPVDGGDDCTVLELPPVLATSLVARHDPATDTGRFRRGSALATSRVVRIHYQLLRRIRERPPGLVLDDLLSELVDEVLSSAQGATALTEDRSLTDHKRRELAEETKLALNRAPDRPPTLRELAASLECSPFHLSRMFRLTVGITLRGYLGRLRTRLAAERLSSHPGDLTGLALSLGYADHSHFTNAFRREFGLPPSRFGGFTAQELSSRNPA